MLRDDPAAGFGGCATSLSITVCRNRQKETPGNTRRGLHGYKSFKCNTCLYFSYLVVKNLKGMMHSKLLLFAAVVHARLGTLVGFVARDVALQETYDFVVVGDGTSGLTIADRLTEDPNGERDRAILLSSCYTKYYWGLLMR